MAPRSSTKPSRVYYLGHCPHPKANGIFILDPHADCLVRTAVSMWPDDDEPLVPLDDSLKRIRCMGVLDAWKRSDRALHAWAWRIHGRAFVVGAVLFFLGNMCILDFHEYVSLPPLWFNT